MDISYFRNIGVEDYVAHFSKFYDDFYVNNCYKLEKPLIRIIDGCEEEFFVKTSTKSNYGITEINGTKCVTLAFGSKENRIIVYSKEIFFFSCYTPDNKRYKMCEFVFNYFKNIYGDRITIQQNDILLDNKKLSGTASMISPSGQQGQVCFINRSAPNLSLIENVDPWYNKHKRGASGINFDSEDFISKFKEMISQIYLQDIKSEQR